MKLDSLYNPFASGEKTVAQSAEAQKSTKKRQELPPVQQQPVRPYPWIVMQMQ